MGKLLPLQVVALTMKPGDTVELPDGLGSVEFVDVARFASFDIRYTPGQRAALVFSLLAATGLILSLFLPRRRVWVKAVAAGAGSVVEVAGLARGNDAGLAEEVDGVLAKLREALGEPEEKTPPEDDPGSDPPQHPASSSPATPAVGDHEQPVSAPKESP